MNVTVTNPADPHGSPSYDGPADQAHTVLAPGGYEATIGDHGILDGTEVALLVSESSTLLVPVVDIDKVHARA